MIEIRNLTKSLGEKAILDGLSLKIEKGITYVIIGRSGCGKSVLLKHIVGLLKPDSGEVIVDSQIVNRISTKELNSLRKKIGMVFQNGALFDSLTVAENVGFGLIEHESLPKKEVLARVEESLALVGLAGIGGLFPAELSGGMRKRVSLARALTIKPEIILYDEPTAGVDPITADSINELILNLHDRLKVTSVVVTHDMKSAYRVGTRVAMMFAGKIILEGTPGQIQSTDNPFVKQFINGFSHGPITET